MSINTKEVTLTVTDQQQEASEASQDPRFNEMLSYIKDELYLEPSEFSKHGKFELCSSFSKSGLSERFHGEIPVRIIRFFAGDRPVEAGKPIFAAIMVQDTERTATEYVISGKTDDTVPVEISVEVFEDIPRHSLGRIALPTQLGNSMSSLRRMQKEALLRRTAARANTKVIKKTEDLQPLYDILQKVRGNTEPQ